MSNELKRMLTADYAKARGISVQAVCNAVRKNWALPGVSRYEKIGGSYVFYVNLEQLKKEVRNKKKHKLHV